MRTKLWRMRVAVLMAAALLAGCSSTATSSEPGALRVVLQSEPASMNPVMSPYLDQRVLNAMFDPLILVDKETQELTDGGLIISWEQEDPTTWVLKVRSGVEFHNGEELTPESVAFTILENRDNPHSLQGAFYNAIEDAQASGEDEVVVTTTEPYSPLPNLLAATSALPADYYAEVGADGFAQDPVGTGPFELSSFQSGQEVAASGFDGYWRGEPELGEIRFTWTDDASTRNNLLLSGEADFAFDLSPQFVDGVNDAEGYKVVTGESDYRIILFLDATKPPFDDPDLRTAVNQAINRDGLVNSVFDGVGAIPSNQFIGDLFNEPEEIEPDYSPEEGEILEDTGMAGTDMVLGYTAGKSPGDDQVGTAVAEMLSEIGFEVEQRGEEYGRFREVRDAGEFDAFIFETLPVFRHPDALASYYVGSGASVQTCPEPERYDAIMDDALAATAPEEADEAYFEIESLAVEEHTCMVPVLRSVYSYGLAEDVQGFDFGPVDVIPDYFLMSKPA